MSSNVTSRATVQAEIASVLETALVGTGLPLQKVYGYMPTQFTDDSGNIVHFAAAVAPTGAHRSVDGCDFDEFMFSIIVSVLYSSDDDSWTEEDSIARLNDVEKRLTDALKDAQTPQKIYRFDGSTIDIVAEDGGVSYWLEEHKITARYA